MNAIECWNVLALPRLSFVWGIKRNVTGFSEEEVKSMRMVDLKAWRVPPSGFRLPQNGLNLTRNAVCRGYRRICKQHGDCEAKQLSLSL